MTWSGHSRASRARGTGDWTGPTTPGYAGVSEHTPEIPTALPHAAPRLDSARVTEACVPVDVDKPRTVGPETLNGRKV